MTAEKTAEKTAGMVRGTPDWQRRRLFEEDAEQAWEDLNEPAPRAIEKLSFEALNHAWAALETMRSSYQILEDNFATCAEKLKGTPEADKLAGLFDKLTDIATECREIQQELRNECHRAWTERRFAG